jgi:hypothetical protein
VLFITILSSLCCVMLHGVIHCDKVSDIALHCVVLCTSLVCYTVQMRLRQVRSIVLDFARKYHEIISSSR